MELRNAQVVTTVPVTDLERARRFYSDKLGLDLCSENRDRGELLYEAGGGSHILVYRRPTPSRSDATTMSFIVDDLRKTADWLRDRGIAFEDYDMPRMGIRTDHGIAEMDGESAAWFKDPDGNIIAITQSELAWRVLHGERVSRAVA
jgi:catechol 2,3-dioxygenase-like lactoylglutathione lyase family enzyme